MKDTLYFKNLHGFRFIAASLVILTHLELFKRRAGLPNFWANSFYFEAGGAGVDFFFVLSGFLITSLLFKELHKTNKINLRKFYLRRILRIWPLYYLILGLCYFILPRLEAFHYEGYSNLIYTDFWPKFLYSLFFLPNVALSFFMDIPYAAPLWSVGVEEQFYLFWPILIWIFPRKYLSIVLFILFFVFIKGLLLLINSRFHIDPDLFERVKNFIVATRMECMGIGALGAYWVFKRHILAKWLSSNVALLLALLILPLVFLFAKNLFELHHIIFSGLFLIIILNGATNQNTWINLEHRFFITLGNISYSLYLWHMIIIGLVLNILMKSFEGAEIGLYFNIIYYVSVFLLSSVVSWISYNFYEKPFLRIKKRYTVIVSGMDARN